MNNGKIVIFDFDGTLTPYSVARLKILEKCGIKGGIDNAELWDSIMMRIQNNDLDFFDAVYEELLISIRNAGLPLTDDSLSLGAEDLEYNNGVFEFLQMLYRLGVNNYLVSSGIKPLLDRTSISGFFSAIYATTFKYDNGKIVAVGDTVSDGKKVDIIKEIMKSNDKDDCSDIIYVGDGLTDLCVMEYVKDNGGTSVFVYLDEEGNEDLKKAKNMSAVSYFALADFTEGSALSDYIKQKCLIK